MVASAPAQRWVETNRRGVGAGARLAVLPLAGLRDNNRRDATTIAIIDTERDSRYVLVGVLGPLRAGRGSTAHRPGGRAHPWPGRAAEIHLPLSVPRLRPSSFPSSHPPSLPSWLPRSFLLPLPLPLPLHSLSLPLDQLTLSLPSPLRIARVAPRLKPIAKMGAKTARNEQL